MNHADGLLTCLISYLSTPFMYVGILVSSIQKPQFCAECTTINAYTGNDVRISAHGVFMCFFSLNSGSSSMCPSDDWMYSRSAAEINLFSAGELLPMNSHKMAQSTATEPEK